MVCSAKGTSERVVGQVERGVREIVDDGRVVSWGRSGFVCQTRWGQFFRFVQQRGDGQRDLRTDVERWRAGVLVLVVACGCQGCWRRC